MLNDPSLTDCYQDSSRDGQSWSDTRVRIRVRVRSLQFFIVRIRVRGLKKGVCQSPCPKSRTSPCPNSFPSLLRTRTRAHVRNLVRVRPTLVTVQNGPFIFEMGHKGDKDYHVI